MGSQLARHKEQFEANPGAAASFAVLEEHHFMAEEWADLVALYEKRLSAPILPAQRADLLVRLGRILEERCGNPEGSIERYTEALSIQPDLRAPMTFLRRIHARREAWEQMFLLAEKEAGLPLKPHERAGVLFEVGKVCLDGMQDLTRARGYLERALADVPVHRETLATLARVLEKLDQPEETVLVLKRLAQQTRGPDQARALQQAGQLCANRLNQVERAGHFFQAALEIDPSNQAAREGLARLETSGKAETRKTKVREESRRELDLPGEKVEPRPKRKVRPAAIVKPVDKTEPPAPRAEPAPSVETHLEAAALAAARGDGPGAIASLERGLKQDPAHVESLEMLAVILSRSQRYGDATNVLERLADATPDPSGRGAVLTRLGTWLEQNLADPMGALVAYERALQADPSLTEPFDALCQLYDKTGGFEKLRSLLDAFRRFGDPERRVGILVQLGELLEGRFQDIEGAVCAFEEALDLEPEEPRAQKALARLAGTAPQKERLIRRYMEQARTTADPAQRLEIAGKLVPLLEQVNRPEEALGWACRIVGESGGDRNSLELVARLQGSLGLANELRDTLERLETFLDDSERVQNRGCIAELHSTLGQRDAAITTYQSMLALEPENRQALTALIPLLTGTERWIELAKVRERLAGGLDSPARERCLSELATLYIEHLKDLDAGIGTMQRLENEPCPPPGLGPHLDALLVREGRFDQLAQRLAQRRAGLGHDAQQVLALARAEARIRAHQLGQWREAIDALRAAGPAVFDDPEGLAELERCARGAQDDALLVEVLAESAVRAKDPHARLGIAIERARVLEGLPGRRDEAREAYGVLLTQHPDEVTRAEILRRLEAILEQSEDWAALRAMLDQQLESATPERAAQIHARLGWLCLTQHQEAAAAAHFEELVSRRPTATDAWRQLATHYAGAQQPQAERRALEGWLAAGPGAQAARDLHARLARLCSSLGDADSALTHHSEAFKIDPADAEASEFLYDAHRRGGRAREAVNVLESRLAALGAVDGEGAREAARLLRLRIAEQRADALQDLAGAIAVLEPAIGDGPDIARYAERLAGLYERAGNGEKLIELSKRVMMSTSAPGDRAPWQYRIAKSLQARGLVDEAIAAYRSLTALDPSDPRVEQALAELYRARGEAEPLVALLEKRLERLRGAPALALHVECAALLAERLSRFGPALDHLRRALAIAPGHTRATDLGLDIASRLGETSAELEFLKHALAGATPIRDRCRRLGRLGELQLANGKPDEAVSRWSEALTLDPRQPALCTRLRLQLEEMGRTGEALNWLAVEADQASGEAGAVLCERGAELAVGSAGPEAALPWLERLRRLRPTDASIAARLADLNERLGRHAAALRALEAQRAHAPAEETADIEIRRARIYDDHLGLPARAIACLEAARTVVPSAARVLQQLEGLYARAGRHRERAEVLEALLPSTPPETRVERMRELAKLWGGLLADPERATRHLFDALREVQEGDPGAAPLLAELGGCLASTGRRVEWAQVAERELRARLAESGGEIESEACHLLRAQLARAYERELCRPDLALSHWERRVDAGQHAAPGAPRSLDYDEAEAALLRLLRSEGRLVELEHRLTAHVERSLRAPATWIELASLRERLLLVPGAAAAWRRVLELDPHSIEAVRGVQRTAERLAQWPELAQMVERELDLAVHAPAGEQAALLRRLADLRLHRLADPGGARSALERVLALGEEEVDSLRALETLLESSEDWEAARDVYQKEIEHLARDEPARRRALWLRIAEIERQHHHAPESALAALQQADTIDPLTGDLLRRRAELEFALGDKKAYARTRARWCDDPGVGCTAADHADLARLLDELGQRADALARIELAVSGDNVEGQVWALAGELREKHGHSADASRAYVRAADASGDDEAALLLGKAAALLNSADFAGGCDLLKRAIHVSRRPIPSLHARHIRAATELGRHADVIESAICLHELAETQPEVLERGELLNHLVAGARSARTLERPEVMAQLCAGVLKLKPDHEEALAGAAEAFFELESWGHARPALEQLLALGGREAQRAQDLTRLGIVLERLQAPADAADRYRMALKIDPTLEVAGEGLIRALRDSGRLTECLDALLERARGAGATPVAADRFVRAAEIARELGRIQEAIEHLRAARKAAPGEPRAWLQEVQLLAETGELEAADVLASEGLQQLEDATTRAEFALGRGRSLETAGKTSAAADLYRLAAELDPNQVPAALGAARMLHSLGEPKRACEVLSQFLATFPSADTYASAPIWLAAGALRAGPMDDPQGAAEAYRRALEMAPDLTLARDALAELLVRLPDSGEESLVLHAQILRDRPTDLRSLRALLTLADAAHDAKGVAAGHAILTALGAATPEERECSDGRLRLTVAGAARFGDELWESARRLLRAGSKAVDRTLAPAVPSATDPGGPAVRFRRAASKAEAKMTAACCASLGDGELRDLVVVLAELAAGSAGPSPDRPWAPSISNALGWFARRRLKRALASHSPGEIAGIDFSAWRTTLRRMARAQALDATEGDLAAALVAVVSDRKELKGHRPDPGSDLTLLVADCPAGCDLMRDVTLSWARSLSHTGRKGDLLGIE